MKKIIYSVVILLVAVIMFSCKKESGSDPKPVVVTDGIYLYGFDEDKADIATSVGNASGEATFDMAAEFAGADIAAKASEIIGVRMYVAKGGEGGVAYVANTLGTRVVEKAFTVENPGWQYVLFDAPIEVSPNNKYYVGFECTGSGYFIGCDKVSGKAQYTYIYDEGEWSTFSAIGLSNYTIALQAICQGGDYSGETQHALSVAGCSFPEHVRIGETIKFSVYVMSLGVKTTGNVKVTCDCGPDEMEAEVSNIRNGEVKAVDFTLDAVSSSMKNVVVTVTETGITGTATEKYAVNLYAADAPDRKCILIEEFTSQSCGNCPDGIATMRQAIAGMEHPEKAAWIAYHAGYQDDDFTLQGDKTIASTFGVNAAPQCMINRSKVDYGKGTAELIWHPGYATSALLDNLASIPADASIEMNMEFTADSTIEVTVSGKSLKSAAYVTIVLCQDSLVARQSSGGNDFVHNEVARAYLTAATGDQLTLDGDGNYTYTVSYTIPAQIFNYTNTKSFATDFANMYVVAFVHGKASSKSAVYNADKRELID